MTTGPTLLTGASGLLGHWLLRLAPARTNLVAVEHRLAVIGADSVTADLRDPTAVERALDQVSPSLVIHAAYAKDRASIVGATRNVVDAATAIDARVLFVSTDAVFGGDGVERHELSPPDPTWDYGRWKAAAERIVLEAAPHNTVVRLPLLVSLDPDDHVVREIRAAATDGLTTRWFTDEIRRPAMASDVAAAIWRLASLPAQDRSGCWHLAGRERLSRYEIARRLIQRLELPDAVIEAAVQPSASVRPRDIAFTDARARDALEWRPARVL